MDIKGYLPVRGTDKYGSGAFGAPRGDHTHRGVDFSCYPGTAIQCLYGGTVTKLGYPYGDDLSFRYVQVETSHEREHRYFYVFPAVSVGTIVRAGNILGYAQDLFDRYPGITGHVHFEIRQRGEYLDPRKFC